ncbi:unnamed protein product [Ilex paraguariensis]|uniref:Brf1 TBP-binding domain-containing protein n=1 Tax=Ilex paraguariensis TaxID=185542 RepID=A0ABC8R015_9AQUA
MFREQAAKEAAAAAAKEACEANFHNCPEGMQAAQELAAAAAAAVAKSRKERQQRRAAEASNSSPPQTAAEATRQMLTKKRLMSKVNYDVLEKLFDESAAPENAKKIRTKSDSYNDGNVPHSSKEDTELKGPYEDSGVTGAAYINDMCLDNMEGYDYDDGYDFDEY